MELHCKNIRASDVSSWSSIQLSTPFVTWGINYISGAPCTRIPSVKETATRSTATTRSHGFAKADEWRKRLKKAEQNWMSEITKKAFYDHISYEKLNLSGGSPDIGNVTNIWAVQYRESQMWCQLSPSRKEMSAMPRCTWRIGQHRALMDGIRLHTTLVSRRNIGSVINLSHRCEIPVRCDEAVEKLSVGKMWCSLERCKSGGGYSRAIVSAMAFSYGFVWHWTSLVGHSIDTVREQHNR